MPTVNLIKNEEYMRQWNAAFSSLSRMKYEGEDDDEDEEDYDDEQGLEREEYNGTTLSKKKLNDNSKASLKASAEEKRERKG